MVAGLEPRYFLFLSATPVQNDLMELYRLVELLRPGTFASATAFRRRFVSDDDPPFQRIVGFAASAILPPGGKADVAIVVPFGNDWRMDVEGPGKPPVTLFWGPHLARCTGRLEIEVTVREDGSGYAAPRGRWCGNP